ncbi:MAG: S-layer homology domain-containing protein [Peptoniphilus sp.]|nr:S-layer homology domain-containing protein [Peptoniphilus sp.]MDY3119079.1 S-layer homology domain-containing protein [Peptoniphilus sp.]
MKKIVALVLTVCMLLSYVPIAFAQSGDTEKLEFIFSDSYNAELVQDKMKVVFVNTKTDEETVIENADQAQPGKITVDLQEGGMYRIELRETKYEITNNGGIFTVSRSGDGKAQALFNSNGFDATRLTVDKWIDTKAMPVRDNENKKIEGELTFVLKDALMPNVKGREYTTVDGKLPPMRLLADAEYILKLKQNDTYEMKDRILSGFIDGEEPIGEDDRPMDTLVVNKKGTTPKDPEGETDKPNPPKPEPDEEKTIDVTVWDNHQSTETDGLLFDLISEEGTKEYKVEYSNLQLKLKEGVDYTLRLKSTENHTMEDVKCHVKYDNGFGRYFLFSEDNRVITKVTVNKKEEASPKRKGTKILSVKCDGADVEEELDFTIEHNGETRPLMTDNSGTLMLRGLIQGESYTLKLTSQETYEMDPVSFTFDVPAGFDKKTGILDAIKSDGSLLEYLELREKGTSSSESREFSFEVKLGNEQGKKIDKDLRFRLRSANEVSQNVNSEEGNVKLTMKDDKIYLLSIMDNEDYSLYGVFKYDQDGTHEERFLPNQDKEVEISYTKEEHPRFVVVVKNRKDQPVQPGQCPSDICRFSDETVHLKEVPIVVTDGYKTKTPGEDVRFVLFNASRQEYEKEIVAKNGVLPALDLYKYDRYILFTKDKNYTMFEEYIQANGEGKLPFNHKKEQFVQNIVLNKKDGGKEELNRTNVVLPVKYEGKSVSDINIKFVSEYETVVEPCVDGMVRANLLEDIQYSVIIDSNVYSIDTLPLTVKDKSEWNFQKHPYDHSSCGGVGALHLVKKGEENKNKTEIVCSKGNTKVTGMNFKDYMLHTDRRDTSKIAELKDKDADIFIIRLINPHRCEVSKIAQGKFTIERKINPGKIVEKAYLVSKDGQLKEIAFTQKGNLVYVDVDTLSIYDLAFVYKKGTTPTPETEPQPVPNPSTPGSSVSDKKEGFILLTPIASSTTEKKVPALAINGIYVPYRDLSVTLTDIPADGRGDAIRAMVKRGVLVGMGEDKFMPDTTISRAMVTEVFMRISKEQEAKSKAYFTDVHDKAWYAHSVRWAATNSLIKGYEDGSFKPNAKVSYEEFAVMLDNLLREYKLDLPKVKNVNASEFAYVSEWSRGAVVRMVEVGLMKTDARGKVQPQGEYSRADLADTLHRLIQWSDKENS